MFISTRVGYRGRKIPIADLKPSSCIKVDVKCPKCKRIRSVHYRSLVKAGHHICQSCKMKELSKQIKVGTRFEMLSVMSIGKKSGYSLCQCICGNIKEISNRNLYSGQQSCGCVRTHNFDNINRPKGPQHGMWRGGVSGERQRAMQTKEYRDWRTRVFKRDGFVCAKCGVLGTTLNAHHIEPFSINLSGRFDEENGITLCERCHVEFHKGFGRKDIGTTQLQIFLKGDYNAGRTKVV